MTEREWQPIETAYPAFTGPCLFFGDTVHDEGIVFSGWVSGNGRTYSDNGSYCEATHWMPLPSPPIRARTTQEDK